MHFYSICLCNLNTIKLKISITNIHTWNGVDRLLISTKVVVVIAAVVVAIVWCEHFFFGFRLDLSLFSFQCQQQCVDVILKVIFLSKSTGVRESIVNRETKAFLWQVSSAFIATCFCPFVLCICVCVCLSGTKNISI